MSIIDAMNAAAPFAVAAALSLFVVVAASLARLKSIGILALANKSAGKAARAESAIHAVGKFMLSILLIVGLARAVLAPDYPGGLLYPDGPMLFSAVIMLAASIPSVGVIYILSRRKKRDALFKDQLVFATVAAISVVAGGVGQCLAAAAAANLTLSSVIAGLPALWFVALPTGAILTVGVIAHFKVYYRIAVSDRMMIRLISADAALASFPTIMAIFLAALAVLTLR